MPFLLANATFDAVSKIGYPESRIILSQCAIYLASSAKSNASYMAISEAPGYGEKNRRPACAVTYPKCADQTDEKYGLFKRIRVQSSL